MVHVVRWLVAGLLLGFSLVLAQVPELSGTLADVMVRGSSDYETLIKTQIRSRAWDTCLEVLILSPNAT